MLLERVSNTFKHNVVIKFRKEGPIKEKSIFKIAMLFEEQSKTRKLRVCFTATLQIRTMLAVESSNT